MFCWHLLHVDQALCSLFTINLSHSLIIHSCAFHTVSYSLCQFPFQKDQRTESVSADVAPFSSEARGSLAATQESSSDISKQKERETIAGARPPALLHGSSFPGAASGSNASSNQDSSPSISNEASTGPSSTSIRQAFVSLILHFLSETRLCVYPLFSHE